MSYLSFRDLKTNSSSVILVVERVEEVRDSVRQLLSEMNYVVVAASNENEAVEQAKQIHPTLIIVNQHEPVSVIFGRQNPSIANRLTDRAQLERGVKLLTHSDSAITISGMDDPTSTYTGANQLILINPQAGELQAQQEWFAYSSDRENLGRLLHDWLPVRFRLGDKVRIRTGPFAMLTGRIEGINQAKKLLKVEVKVSSDVTPVKLPYREVEKLFVM